MRKSNSTNLENEKLLQDTCGLTYAMVLLKGRWTINVLWGIHNGQNRYSLLKKEVDGISEKMLTQSLKAMEYSGLIKRNVFQEAPQRIEYSLTEAGQDFVPLIIAISDWGDKVRPFTKTLV
ncbi:winged helix-turn-helix transcriptional regulator [Aquimarina sp. LLG6339-5]|uniref:winged helix-turn-helix transcriptional regulator n=1 Tax=Aquimarina sp. LLG6339-5 TaxID=3160830 RepID=UPI00386C7691